MNKSFGEYIGWNGGECPVHPKTVVEIWRRCCDTYELKAGGLLWGHCNNRYDIICYRVVKEHVEPMATPKKTVWVNEYNTHDTLHRNEVEARSTADFKRAIRVAIPYRECLDEQSEE